MATSGSRDVDVHLEVGALTVEAKKVLKNMDKDARVTLTLQRRLDTLDAAKTLNTTRKFREIPVMDLKGYLQVLQEARVALPVLVQAKIAVCESYRLIESYQNAPSAEQARKIGLAFGTMHDLSPKMMNGEREFDCFVPLWSDIVKGAIAHDRVATEGLETDWEARRPFEC